jgi:hypothetical protein
MDRALEQLKTISEADLAKVKAIAGMVKSPRSGHLGRIFSAVR